MLFARRDFLVGAGATAVAFASAAATWIESSEAAAPDLVRDPGNLLDLPRGFTYQIISRVGDAMSDGLIMPDRPDGMTSFALGGDRHLLLRNHENGGEQKGRGAFGDTIPAALADRIYDYDDDGMPLPGGVTGLIWNRAEARIEKSWLALAGTMINCSGGKTPWGSWISCEETVAQCGENTRRDHGFNFEIPAHSRSLVDPLPLKAMGRFRHEGVAIDPSNGIAYQTEDRKNGLFYRFVPKSPGEMVKGGRLQALAIRGEPGRDTRNWRSLLPGLPSERMAVRKPVMVDWVDVDDVENPDDDLRVRGASAGAAIFARGEGVWFGRGEVFFACTSGGANEKGQIWHYRPSRFEGRTDEAKSPGMLTLWSEPGDSGAMDRCDNIVIHPSGALIVCEDGKQENYIRILARSGAWRRAARNAHTDGGELTGACFTPDGKTMFVNLQDAGLTLAISGPWAELV